MLNLPDITFWGKVIFKNIPDKNVSSSKGETTPDVTNIDILSFKNVAQVIVTNFLGGKDGQKLDVLGDGFTQIKRSDGLTITLAANKIYKFTLIDNVWYENA